ncbi:hypothetical protein ACLB2K_062752 [Fragaria x ananassa]
MKMSTNMEIAEDAGENIMIVGGGICGLATALAIHRGQFTSLDDNKLQQIPFGKDELRCVKSTEMMNILADNLPQNTVRFGCYVLSIELDPITSSPVLKLQDGTSLNAKVHCSISSILVPANVLKPCYHNLFSPTIKWSMNQVVIGCDGVNSTISYMLGVRATNTFNICVARGFTIYPSGHEFGSEFNMAKKDDVQVGLIPLTTNPVYWFVTGKYISQKTEFKISESKKLIADMAAASVKDFPSSIQEMVENCSQESLHFSEYLRYQAPWDLLRSRRFRVGTVIVAGDALHAMAPFIAQGGAASFEDAVVLTRCLARKTNVGNPSGIVSETMVEEALDEYLKKSGNQEF